MSVCSSYNNTFFRPGMVLQCTASSIFYSNHENSFLVYVITVMAKSFVNRVRKYINR